MALTLTGNIQIGGNIVLGGGATPTDFSTTTFYQVRVYNQALTTTAIATNYSTVKSAYPGLSLP